MPYDPAAIRTSADGGESVLQPLVRPDDSGVAIEPDDGRISTYDARSLSVSYDATGNTVHAFNADGLKLELCVTDTRITWASPKFKSTGPGPRRRGCLVGHVRYSWLEAIGFRSQTGVISPEDLRLVVIDKTRGSPTKTTIDISLRETLSARKLAETIAQRAARHRLNTDKSLTVEDRTSLGAISIGLRVQPGANGEFSMAPIAGARPVDYVGARSEESEGPAPEPSDAPTHQAGTKGAPAFSGPNPRLRDGDLEPGVLVTQLEKASGWARVQTPTGRIVWVDAMRLIPIESGAAARSRPSRAGMLHDEEPATPPAEWAATARVPAAGIDLREGPKEDRVKIRLDAGTPIQVVDTAGVWVLARSREGVAGWVDGRLLERLDPRAEPTCRECGAAIKSNAKFCSECGTPT